MRWLLHGPVDPSVPAALQRHGQKVQPGETSMMTPAAVLAFARREQLDVLTRDAALIDAAIDPEIGFARTLVYLQLPGGDVEQDDAVDRLFARYKRLGPGRLYTVTETRVKVRQMPRGA